jgi:hypothetical protein
MMKVLIKDEESRLYAGYQGGWTDCAIEARDYCMSLHARSEALKLNLKKFSVLFYFPESDYKIVVCESSSG